LDPIINVCAKDKFRIAIVKNIIRKTIGFVIFLLTKFMISVYLGVEAIANNYKYSFIEII
jgi:hypothetical protein